MTDAYIDAHFEAITKHGSDIETRLDDSCCTIAALKADNRKYIDGCRKAGERIVLIDADYEQTIRALLE